MCEITEEQKDIMCLRSRKILLSRTILCVTEEQNDIMCNGGAERYFASNQQHGCSNCS